MTKAMYSDVGLQGDLLGAARGLLRGNEENSSKVCPCEVTMVVNKRSGCKKGTVFRGPSYVGCDQSEKKLG
jgi:hypothetical protein